MVQKTEMENIIDSIESVRDRYKVIESLKTLVYDTTKFTNEKDYLQKIIEQNFWLFGEQYNFASADIRMRNALQQYTNILYGEEDIHANLQKDAEQERQMDIFLCNTRTTVTSYQTTIDENTVLVLKAPNVPLSKKFLRQIEDYMDYIVKQPDFNDELRLWKFIVVCKEMDEDAKTRLRLDSWKEKREVGLISQTSNYEVYAFTWNDLFKNFELVHAPLLKRLKDNRVQLEQEEQEKINKSKCCNSSEHEDEDTAYQEALAKVIQKHPDLKERQKKLDESRRRHDKLQNIYFSLIAGCYLVSLILILASFGFPTSPLIKSIGICGQILFNIIAIILMLIRYRKDNKFQSDAGDEKIRLRKDLEKAFQEEGYEENRKISLSVLYEDVQ